MRFDLFGFEHGTGYHGVWFLSFDYNNFYGSRSLLKLYYWDGDYTFDVCWFKFRFNFKMKGDNYE